MVKKAYWLLILLVYGTLPVLAQSNADSIKLARATFIKSQTVKADSLNNAALKLATPNADAGNLNKAIANIMAGLHVYSKFRDSVGLRETFDHLGLVYHLQKKYTQAKWFIIQSNSLSRERHDTLNIIASLINLAAVKEDIKDFGLAKRDLNEALSLSKTQPDVGPQVDVQKALAVYYTKKGDSPGAAMALNRIKLLNDSVEKAIAGRTNAAIKQDTFSKATSTLINKGPAQHGGLVIILATIITIILAFIFILVYLKSKKRSK